MEQAEEKRILEAVLRGHKEQFEAVVRAYHGQAYAVAVSLVGNRSDAMDLCQDAFLHAFRGLKTFDTTLPFFPWFYRILKNLCLSHLKRRRRSLSLNVQGRDGEERAIDVPANVPDPSDLVERNEAIERCYEAFAKLPDRDREILALRHFRDLSYAEIAAVLSIPIGTVMSRLFYARRKLKGLMQEELP